MKRIDEVIVWGAYAPKKHNKLLVVAFADIFLQIFLVVIFGIAGFVLGGLSIAGAAMSGSIIIAIAIIASIAIGYFISSMALSAFFTSALVTGCWQAHSGGKPTFRSMFELAKSKWLLVLQNMLVVLTISVLLLVLFTPAVIAALMQGYIAAAGLGALAFAIIIAFSSLFMIAISPLYYIVVLKGSEPPKSLYESYGFVKQNLAACLILTFSNTMAQSLLFSPITLISGPLRLLDHVVDGIGSSISALFSIIAFSIVFIGLKVITTAWWTAYVSERLDIRSPEVDLKEFEDFKTSEEEIAV